MTGILAAADSSVDTDGDGAGGGLIFSVRYIRRIRYANGADIISRVVTAATKDLFSSSTCVLGGSARRRTCVSSEAARRHRLGFQTRPTVATGRDGTCVVANDRGREKRGRTVKDTETGTFGNNHDPRLKVPYYAKKSTLSVFSIRLCVSESVHP